MVPGFLVKDLAFETDYFPDLWVIIARRFKYGDGRGIIVCVIARCAKFHRRDPGARIFFAGLRGGFLNFGKK